MSQRSIFLFFFFFICLSISSTQYANAFHETAPGSSRTIHRRNDHALRSTTTTRTESASSRIRHNSKLSDAILNTNGGATATAAAATSTTTTIFPPPIRTLIRSIAIEPTVVAPKRRQLFLVKHKQTILAMCLMGFSGVVESICYRQFKCFPNMMTGNTVRAMEAISTLNWQGMQFNFGLIGSYISGCTLYKFLDRAQIFNSSNNKSRAIPTPVWLSAIVFVFFGLSDVVGMTSEVNMMRLLPMAAAFGMVNCATQEMTGGFVTNAATGHFGKIGFGLGESIVMNMLGGGGGKNKNTNNGDAASKQTIKYGITSTLVIGSFVTALISTNLIGAWLDAKHSWMNAKLPPLGLSLGVAYSILLTSYHHFSKKIEKYNV